MAGTAPALVWNIKNFSKLSNKWLYSDVFVAVGYRWQLVACPKGNANRKVDDHLSLYLAVADSITLPDGWSRDIEFFIITVVNQTRADSIAKKMDAEPSSLFTIIKVSRDKDIRKQIGRVIYFDLVDHDKVCSFNVLKDTPFKLFKDEVAKEFCIPVQLFRFWSWWKVGWSYRPWKCLTSQQEAKSVEELRLSLGENDYEKFNLFLEVELGLDLYPTLPPAKTEDDILVFFKLYDPVKEQLRYVGRLFVKKYAKPIDILGKLNQMACFAPDEEIELYEEIFFDPHLLCEHLDKRTSFRQSEIKDGDIICFQKSPLGCAENRPYPDVPSFLEYVLNRQMRGVPDNTFVSLTATSLLENLTNVLAGISRTKRTKISTPSSEMSESGLPSNPQSLQEHLILKSSTCTLERSILKDVASRLAAFKEMLRVGKSRIEYMRAQLTSLTGKKAAVGARLDQALEHGGSLESKLSKLSEEETELEKQIMHLTTQKEGLLIKKNSVALEVQKFNDQVTDDAAEWQDITEEVEKANIKCLQERETLAQANLSWKLFQQNLEQCVKFA